MSLRFLALRISLRCSYGLPLVIRVWKEKEKTHRRDIIDELIHLLNCRFFLGSAVYFHHAKLITSAMIARAIQQALSSKIITKETLWQIGDEELLLILANNSKDRLAKSLAESLLNRRFYDDFFEFSRDEADAVEQVEILKMMERNYHASSAYRKKEEDRLSELCDNGQPGDVLIYCPDPKMSLKEAEMMILWKRSPMQFHLIEDKLYKDKIESIINSHKKLWAFKVFISQRLQEKLNNEKYSSLLKTWCNHLVNIGTENEEEVLKNAINITVLDIYQKKGYVDEAISAAVCEEVFSNAARRGAEEDTYSRKYIEKIIDERIEKKK